MAWNLSVMKKMIKIFKVFKPWLINRFFYSSVSFLLFENYVRMVAASSFVLVSLVVFLFYYILSRRSKDLKFSDKKWLPGKNKYLAFF